MIRLPSNLDAYLANADWTPITIGCSVAQTFCLQLPGHKGMYLKVVDQDTRRSLQPEYERLAWLQGELPVPGIIEYETEDNIEDLLTFELPGTHAADRLWSDRLPIMVRELALALRRIHNVPIEKCPFDKCLEVRIDEARRNIETVVRSYSPIDLAPLLFSQVIIVSLRVSRPPTASSGI